MKICIYTQPLLNNYGGILQNFALQKFLEGLGHYVITVDQPMFRPLRFYEIFYFNMVYWVKRYILGKSNAINYNDYRYFMNTINPQFKEFVDRYIVHTSPIYGRAELRRHLVNNDVDCCIVGSDQIWRKEYNSRWQTNFLDFSDGYNVKKIAYAASFGNEQWNFSYYETKQIKHWLRSFLGVSVREKEGLTLVKEHLGLDANLVVDPTLLISKAQYERLFIDVNTTGDYIFTYFLDDSKNKQQIVNLVSNYYNIKVKGISPNKLEKDNLPSIESWLSHLYHSSFVISDSFHGMVFSIIFNKPFIVLSNTTRGNGRLASLLTQLDLMDRLVLDSESDVIHILMKTIQWKSINKQVLYLRNQSITFLKEVLHE